jgi:hypothetical protein
MKEHIRNLQINIGNWSVNCVAMKSGFSTLALFPKKKNSRLGEDGFCEAENVLSRDCIFLFRKNQQGGGEQNQIIGGEGQNQQPIAEGIDLLESESTRRWKDVVDNYLVRIN